MFKALSKDLFDRLETEFNNWDCNYLFINCYLTWDGVIKQKYINVEKVLTNFPVPNFIEASIKFIIHDQNGEEIEARYLRENTVDEIERVLKEINGEYKIL